MESGDVFKTCPACATQWQTRQAFLTDPALELNGYQVSLKALESGFLLFTHHIPECESTIGIYVSEFSDLYTGERYSENRALSPECPRYCIDEKNLGRCTVVCECAYVREIIQAVLTTQAR